MKNFTKWGAIALMGAAVAATSCNKDDDGGASSGSSLYDKTNFLVFTEGVALELSETADALYDAWTIEDNEAYFEMSVGSDKDYETQQAALMEIIDGIVTIAEEVYDAKIGDPYDVTAPDIYAVESWYSHRSFIDYRDNIYSIQNAFYGKVIDSTVAATDAARGTLTSASAATNSLYSYLLGGSTNKQETEAGTINTAINACILLFNDLVDDNDTMPFRAYVLALYTDPASDSDIDDLVESIEAIAEAFEAIIIDEETSDADNVIADYVTYVVKPTYLALKNNASDLYDAVKTYCANPTQTNIEAAVEKWKLAREPWEQSEAFLFGPVDTELYDPHLDSWPLDQTIINVVLSYPLSSAMAVGAFSDSVLGFHTLEYLLFKDGTARKVSELFDGDTVNIEDTDTL